MAGSVGGRLGQALRSDAYADFREGQLTLVKVCVGVGVGGQIKVALPTLRPTDLPPRLRPSGTKFP